MAVNGYGSASLPVGNSFAGRYETGRALAVTVGQEPEKQRQDARGKERKNHDELPLPALLPPVIHRCIRLACSGSGTRRFKDS